MAHRMEKQIAFGNDKQRCKSVFGSDKRKRGGGRGLWLAGFCAAICMRAASAQQAAARTVLHPEQIEAAMERAQLPTRGVQVKMAAAVTASTAEPRLEIKSMAMIGPRELRLRVGCSERSECLPFFAIAMYAQAIDAASLPVKLNEKAAGSEQAVHEAKEVEAPAAAAGAPVIRSGSPATLDMDSDKVHVRIEVVCLENGAAGDKVRVATRDRKLTYVAKVVNSTLVKGTF